MKVGIVVSVSILLNLFCSGAAEEKEKINPANVVPEATTKNFSEGILSFSGPLDLALASTAGFDSHSRSFMGEQIDFSYEWTLDSKGDVSMASKTLQEIVRQWTAAGYPDDFSPKLRGVFLGSIKLHGHDQFSAERKFPNYLYLMCEPSDERQKGYLCLHLYFSDFVSRSEVYDLVDSIVVNAAKH